MLNEPIKPVSDRCQSIPTLLADSLLARIRPPARTPEKQAAVTEAYLAIIQALGGGPLFGDKERSPEDMSDLVEGYLVQEQNQRYWMGCPDIHDMRAFIALIEAGRLLAACERSLAVKLLRLAAREIER